MAWIVGSKECRDRALALSKFVLNQSPERSEGGGEGKDRPKGLSLRPHCSVFIVYCLLPTVYCLLLVGCARGTDISNLYQYRFTMMYPSTGTLDFEDDALRFAFRPSRERIDLTIENKGAQPVELDWSKVEYEDRYGAVHKVTAQDVKPEEKDKPQAATIIAPGTKLETWVLPSDHVSRSIGRRKTKPLLPELKTAFDVDSWDRTTFNLVMPLKVGEEKKDYKFSFRARVD